MRKRSRSGITVNGVPLDTVVEAIEDSQPDDFCKEAVKPTFYHRPRIVHRTNEKGHGPMKHNYYEVNRREMAKRVRLSIDKKKTAHAIIAIMLGTQKPRTLKELAEKINSLLPAGKTINDHSCRAHIPMIAQSKLKKYLLIKSDNPQKPKTYCIEGTVKDEMSYDQALMMYKDRPKRVYKKTAAKKPATSKNVLSNGCYAAGTGPTKTPMPGPIGPPIPGPIGPTDINPPLDTIVQKVHFDVSVSINIKLNVE